MASKPSPLLLSLRDRKNKLWNKIREEVLGIPVKTIPQTETTVLGAIMFAFAGIGIYGSFVDAIAFNGKTNVH